MKGAGTHFTDQDGRSAIDAAAGGSDEARRALKREEKQQRVCAFCGAVAGQDAPKLKRCANCRLVLYCSPACQRKHWKAGHKAECRGAVLVLDSARVGLPSGVFVTEHVDGRT